MHQVQLAGQCLSHALTVCMCMCMCMCMCVCIHDACHKNMGSEIIRIGLIAVVGYLAASSAAAT